MLKKINWRLYGAVFSANLVTFICGIAYSWTSPVLPILGNRKNIEKNPLGRLITPFEESWLTSSLSVGASIGPFLGALIVDKIGRKKSLLLLAVPTIISHLILAFATKISFFYFSRFLLGLAMGCVYSIVPIYVGEIAEDSNRGALGCFIGTTYTAGTLFSFIIGPYLTIKVFCLIILIPAISFIILLAFFFPESPYYLLIVKKEEEAKMALQKLRTDFYINELEEIRRNVNVSDCLDYKFKDIFQSKALCRALMIGSGLTFFQQCSGITVIISYMQSIFDSSGSSLRPEIAPMIIGGVQLCINLLTSRLVEKWGRRVLLLYSLIGALLSHILLGFYFHLKINRFDLVVSYLFWLPISSLLFFIVMFTVGLGPVTWALLGELFPTQFKSYASTFVTVVCLLTTFLLTLFFPNLIQIIGMAYTFWLFAFFCAGGIIFVWRFVPETKGKSLYDIQILLSSKNK